MWWKGLDLLLMGYEYRRTPPGHMGPPSVSSQIYSVPLEALIPLTSRAQQALAILRTAKGPGKRWRAERHSLTWDIAGLKPVSRLGHDKSRGCSRGTWWRVSARVCGQPRLGQSRELRVNQTLSASRHLFTYSLSQPHILDLTCI